MNKTALTYNQYWRLYKASRIKKYSHLETWKELFLYSSQFAEPQQRKDIEIWAHKANNGEDITLPLKDHVTQQKLV